MKPIGARGAPIRGGRGTGAGPLVGAIFLHGAGESAKGLIAIAGEPRPGLDLILYGVILVLALGFLPRGLVGLWSDLWRKAGRR